jgi:hypothetical protein
MWFDEDNDRGEWCTYSRATVEEMEATPKKMKRQYPEWSSREDEHIIREMSSDELSAAFEKEWGSLEVHTRPKTVRYIKTLDGRFGVQCGIKFHELSKNQDVAEAFCENGGADVMTDDEVLEMFKEELENTTNFYKNLARANLIGYWADRSVGNWTKASVPVAIIHPDARMSKWIQDKIGSESARKVESKLIDIVRNIVSSVEKEISSIS